MGQRGPLQDSPGTPTQPFTVLCSGQGSGGQEGTVGDRVAGSRWVNTTHCPPGELLGRAGGPCHRPPPWGAVLRPCLCLLLLSPPAGNAPRLRAPLSHPPSWLWSRRGGWAGSGESHVHLPPRAASPTWSPQEVIPTCHGPSCLLPRGPRTPRGTSGSRGPCDHAQGAAAGTSLGTLIWALKKSSRARLCAVLGGGEKFKILRCRPGLQIARC